MGTGRPLVIGLFVVLASVTACQSTTTAGAPASTPVSSAPTLSTSSPGPVGTTAQTPSTPGGEPPVTTPPATTAPSVVPVPAEPMRAVPAAQVNTAGMVNPPQSVQVTADGRYVVFTAEESGCQRITAQTTTQTSTEVTIVVTTTSTSKPGQLCPMIVRQVVVAAELSVPLGGRTVVFDGVTTHG
jgi:hypothetical protein